MFPSLLHNLLNIFIPLVFSKSYVMAQRDNLYCRSSGIYVLRVTVPVRYRALIVLREIHASIVVSRRLSKRYLRS